VNVYDVNDLGHAYGTRVALQGVGFVVQPGELLGIAGPNGAGKSTLGRILAGLLPGWTGQVEFFGRSLRLWKGAGLAMRIGYVAQQSEIPFPYRAAEVVLMGRLPQQSVGFFDGARDAEAARRALELVGAAALADRSFAELSGGERQLVVLASALAQEPEVLVLDEPTVFLDLSHRLRFGRVLRELRERQGLTVLLVTHDLELAAAFCDRILLLKAGRLALDLRRDGHGRMEIPGEALASVFDLPGDGRSVRLVYA
jgi:iron complex transport system ATP-binding protein